MAFKFEKLEVWRLALEYIDLIYELANHLPKSEEYNLKTQMIRAATSIALNIAEGSTSQTNTEQARFLSIAIRSLIETVACQLIIKRRNYVVDANIAERAYASAQTLAAKLHSFRKVLLSEVYTVRDESALYGSSALEDV